MGYRSKIVTMICRDQKHANYYSMEGYAPQTGSSREAAFHVQGTVQKISV